MDAYQTRPGETVYPPRVCGPCLWCPVQKDFCREYAYQSGCALADRCGVVLTWEVERGRTCGACQDHCRDRERIVDRANKAGISLARYADLGIVLTTKEVEETWQATSRAKPRRTGARRRRSR